MAIISRYLKLTKANLQYGHIYLTECMDMFPEDVFGGPNKSHSAPRTVRVQFGAEVVDTDIDRKKHFFRRRGWVQQFFSENRMADGDYVLLEQLEPYLYRVSKAVSIRLPCLSIQQPWANFILDGRKLVENRTTKRRSKHWQGRDSGLLSIHASSSQAIWHGCTEKEHKLYAPDWCQSDMSPVKAVLGVVDVVQICQPKDLPPELQGHKFVDKSANWCYVLENPRPLVEPFKMNGNSSLFRATIPRALLPSDLTASNFELPNT